VTILLANHRIQVFLSMHRVGIVKHLNARPLTLFFEKNPFFEPVFDHPAMLAEMLLSGSLDIALISSVEILRNQNKISYFENIGVFAEQRVRSILFYDSEDLNLSSNSIKVDQGSRTSVALLELLLEWDSKREFLLESSDAETIVRALQSHRVKALLFGDHALRNPRFEKYESRDLAEWWWRETSSGFAFAYWAYPKGSKIPSEILMEALNYGEANLDKIIQEQNLLSREEANVYFKEELKFRNNSSITKGWELFQKEIFKKI